MMGLVHAHEPSHIGRYELIAKIGAGATGQVYLARSRGEESFERLFALKVIPWRTEEHAALSALIQEARIASRIHHRNVVGILDVGSYEDGHYLVMEYVEGCTLSEIQRQDREVRARMVLAVVIDALYGLHAAHSLKDDDGIPLHLVHRDISPQNLLIGIDGACRVSDFGIAHIRSVVHTTRQDHVKGTVGYMSPEQVMGADLDRRSDIFSIGVVLWNALTGKKLFHAESDQQTMTNVLEREVPRPSTIGLQPPAILDAVVMKALDRDPDKRFATAEEMARSLRDLAIKTSCLGAPTEIAEWVLSVFGADLDIRRRAIREVAPGAAPMPPPELPPRPRPRPDARLGTIGDLTRESDEIPDRAQLLERVATDRAARARRRRIAITATAAFTVVAAVLTWRWFAAAPAAPPPAFEVTVLDVHPLPGAAPVPAPKPTPVAPPAPAAAVPPSPAPPTATVVAPAAAATRTHRPPPTKRAAAAAAHAPASPTPVEPARAETPPDASPKSPPLEDNPYVYK